ncbi:protein PHYLLO, chloroplastic-like isoform X2 [Ziziphus jujuba]|uniref:Protein PHYLLO, chloroplastic-like isoform X2 n=1 Tax=Ziziphus jujuba TaxID=326968 RepID=A0ABM4A6Y6_ZIZJJ|nr:protein PHYLLO, chloroplastic-like isoform X2 [Ziziphus jujuba]
MDLYTKLKGGTAWRKQMLFGVRFDGLIMEISKHSGMEDGDFVVETCITHTLLPALTLEKGLESIKDAVGKLKLNLPSTSNGFFRSQVLENSVCDFHFTYYVVSLCCFDTMSFCLVFISYVIL